MSGGDASGSRGPGGMTGHYRRVVLLGFMASGKSVIGRDLARRLRWRHVDLDTEIVATAGRSIAEIFATDGEAAFRSIEATISPRFTTLEQVVISPGGGWITNPGLFESLPPDTLSVWLKVSPQEVIRRLSRPGRGPERPLLSGSDRDERVRRLLVEREPLYARADLTIDTESRTIDSIVGDLIHIIRTRPPPATDGGAEA